MTGAVFNKSTRSKTPRYSLLLYCLLCLLASLLVAWIGITRPRVGNPGFTVTGARPLAFVEEGKLVHMITRDVIHGGYSPNQIPPVSVRVTVKAELNHDRVLSRTVETCLEGLERSIEALSLSVRTGDFTYIEEYASDRITDINGGAAVKEVRVTHMETIDRQSRNNSL